MKFQDGGSEGPTFYFCLLLYFPLVYADLCQLFIITKLSLPAFVWRKWLDNWRGMCGSKLENEGRLGRLFLWP